MSLEPKIDDLYRGPLAGFTAARNALAKTLSGADKERVRSLAKPTVVPWAVNQLFWKSRPAYDKLMKSGEALRTAQIAALNGRPHGKGPDVKAAAEAHRTALAAAVHQAVQLAAAEGATPDADDLSRMLESLSLAPSAPGHPGRFTELVRPAGFEALAGMSPSSFKPTLVASAPAAATSRAAREANEKLKVEAAEFAAEQRRREREMEARKRAAEAEVTAAERAFERAKEAEVRARAALDEAERERAAARERLIQARKILTSNF